MKKLILLFALLITFHINPSAQVINGYSKVTNISGTTLTLANVDESGDTFEDGEQIIIMQMQDDVIGANTGDNASFGNLGSIASAGLYEVVTIMSHTESGGAPSVPTTITLSNNLNNSYSTSSNSSLQIITFPTFGSPNYTTTSDMSAKSWDGNTGGVLAFNVAGTLTLSHNLDVDGDGFRGASANLDASSAACSGASNYRLATNNDFANKGEGIYKVTSSLYAAGMGKILNGGGGGNSHNAGGGGGSNYSAGGQGGEGYPTCTPSAGGLGGLDLSTHSSALRVFMGGGAGAGEGNNSETEDGGNGAGIMLITANEIETVGSCGGISITANGASVSVAAGGDGNSGGGAGGSIVFEVNSWNIAASCPLTIQSNGGNGGDVNNAAFHGGGGGGGMGAVIFSATQPTTNITTNTAPGNGGRNCTTCSYASNGAGTDGDGIITNSLGPLPIELLSFTAKANNNKEVLLNWATASESNNHYFMIQRSQDAKQWKDINRIEGGNNSTEILQYSSIDKTPLEGISYYRLKQIDFDQSYSFSPIKTVEINRSNTKLFPNPTKNEFFVEGKNIESDQITIVNYLGQTIHIPFNNNNDIIAFDASTLAKGIYFVIIHQWGNREVHKLVVKR